MPTGVYVRTEAHRAKVSAALTIHGHARRTAETAEYRAWWNMLARCHNPNDSRYQYYGGRDLPITVCQRWRDSFPAFLDDMGPHPGPGYSLDRINNDGPYSKDNCRWATAKEQANNRRPRRRREGGRVS